MTEKKKLRTLGILAVLLLAVVALTGVGAVAADNGSTNGVISDAIAWLDTHKGEYPLNGEFSVDPTGKNVTYTIDAVKALTIVGTDEISGRTKTGLESDLDNFLMALYKMDGDGDVEHRVTEITFDGQEGLYTYVWDESLARTGSKWKCEVTETPLIADMMSHILKNGSSSDSSKTLNVEDITLEIQNLDVTFKTDLKVTDVDGFKILFGGYQYNDSGDVIEAIYGNVRLEGTTITLGKPSEPRGEYRIYPNTTLIIPDDFKLASGDNTLGVYGIAVLQGCGVIEGIDIYCSSSSNGKIVVNSGGNLITYLSEKKNCIVELGSSFTLEKSCTTRTAELPSKLVIPKDCTLTVGNGTDKAELGLNPDDVSNGKIVLAEYGSLAYDKGFTNNGDIVVSTVEQLKRLLSNKPVGRIVVGTNLTLGGELMIPDSLKLVIPNGVILTANLVNNGTLILEGTGKIVSDKLPTTGNIYVSNADNLVTYGKGMTDGYIVVDDNINLQSDLNLNNNVGLGIEPDCTLTISKKEEGAGTVTPDVKVTKITNYGILDLRYGSVIPNLNTLENIGTVAVINGEQLKQMINLSGLSIAGSAIQIGCDVEGVVEKSIELPGELTIPSGSSLIVYDGWILKNGKNAINNSGTITLQGSGAIADLENVTNSGMIEVGSGDQLVKLCSSVGGRIQLGGNVGLTQGVVIGPVTEKGVTLNLAGNVLYRSTAATGPFSLILVGNGGKLTLCDTTESPKDATETELKTHKFRVLTNPGETTPVYSATRTAGLWEWNDNLTDDESFKVTGGVITGGKAELGGGVRVELGGTFNLIGGNIIGNTAENAGGVYNVGTFTIGKGKDDDSGIIGDQIITSVPVTLESSIGDSVELVSIGNADTTDIFISGNLAYSEDVVKGNGGGVYNNHIDEPASEGQCTFSTGTISYNMASADGGGIVNCGQSNLGSKNSGVDVIYNSAGLNGGGVYVFGTTQLYDGNIVGNTTGRSGGGVFVDARADGTYGTFYMPEGNIGYNTACLGGGILVDVTNILTEYPVYGSLKLFTSLKDDSDDADDIDLDAESDSKSSSITILNNTTSIDGGSSNVVLPLGATITLPTKSKKIDKDSKIGVKALVSEYPVVITNKGIEKPSDLVKYFLSDDGTALEIKADIENGCLVLDYETPREVKTEKELYDALNPESGEPATSIKLVVEGGGHIFPINTYDINLPAGTSFYLNGNMIELGEGRTFTVNDAVNLVTVLGLKKQGIYGKGVIKAGVDITVPGALNIPAGTTIQIDAIAEPTPNTVTLTIPENKELYIGFADLFDIRANKILDVKGDGTLTIESITGTGLTVNGIVNLYVPTKIDSLTVTGPTSTGEEAAVNVYSTLVKDEEGTITGAVYCNTPLTAYPTTGGSIQNTAGTTVDGYLSLMDTTWTVNSDNTLTFGTGAAAKTFKMVPSSGYVTNGWYLSDETEAVSGTVTADTRTELFGKFETKAEYVAISNNNVNFGTAEVGPDVPNPQKITIENHTTKDATLNFDASASKGFTYSPELPVTIKSGKTVEIEITPKDNLSAGEYKDILDVASEVDSAQSQRVSVIYTIIEEHGEEEVVPAMPVIETKEESGKTTEVTGKEIYVKEGTAAIAKSKEGVYLKVTNVTSEGEPGEDVKLKLDQGGESVISAVYPETAACYEGETEPEVPYKVTIQLKTVNTNLPTLSGAFNDDIAEKITTHSSYAGYKPVAMVSAVGDNVEDVNNNIVEGGIQTNIFVEQKVIDNLGGKDKVSVLHVDETGVADAKSEYKGTAEKGEKDCYEYEVTGDSFSSYVLVVDTSSTGKSSGGSTTTSFTAKQTGDTFTFSRSPVVTEATLPGASSAKITKTSGDGWYNFNLEVTGLNGTGTILFEVPLADISTMNMTVQDVGLYHQENGGWVLKPTTYLKSENGYAHYKATIDSCSPFKIDFASGSVQQGSTETKTEETKKTEESSSDTQGYLKVVTTPAGAKIQIDGVDYIGYTPQSKIALNPGTYTVTLSLDGYKDASQSFTIKAGETTPVTLTLEKKESSTAKTEETQKTSTKTPFPMLGILAGLGVAAVLLRRK